MISRLAALLFIALLGACGNYDFTVNDKTVYTPPPMFSDYSLADAALSSCVQQAIVDQRIKQAVDLSALNCSHAGISDLSGLAVFVGLQHLKLSANELSDIGELTELTALTTLQLDDNAIVDPSPALALPLLQKLDLLGNPKLRCPPTEQIRLLTHVELPQHCQG